MDTIQIYLLGRFEIIVNGQRIDEQLSKSKKGCTLMQYLLLRGGNPAPYSEIYEVLWPNEESANPENALKTLVSRMRVILTKYSRELGNCIATSRGAYRWDTSLVCGVDLFMLEDLCDRLRKMPGELSDETRSMFNRVLELYSGDLLPKNADENWIVSRSVYVQNLYMETVYRYLDLLQAAEENDAIIRVCRRSLEINAFDERLHVKLMDALVRADRNNEALMQYQHATNLHLRYLGMKPSEGIQDFYQQIINAGKTLDQDIDVIRRELCNYQETSGAFVCEYAVFKEIYNLLARINERGGTTMFLALVMLTSVDGEPIEPLKLNDIMQTLLTVLRNTLRKGDTVAHYTPAQYAVLLPLKTYDDGKVVLEKIKNAFYRRSTTSNVIVNYRICPILHSENQQDAHS